MATSIGDRNRNIIPRWRRPKFSNIENESESLNLTEPILLNSNLDSQIISWNNYKTIYAAADLLNSAVLIGKENEYIDVANFLYKTEGVEKNLKNLAYSIINKDSSEKIQLIDNTNTNYFIHKVRKKTINDPYNAIAWLELARLYSIKGKKDKARKCILCALSINKTNRFIVRSSARFFIHNNEPDIAQNLLFKHPLINIDPWLMASEIATNSILERNSLLFKKALKLTESNNYSPTQLSELYSALATMELNNGTIKKSKKLFKKSLLEPNENSVAQAVWATEFKHVVFDSNELLITYPKYSFEALARAKKEVNEFEESLKCVDKWLNDEPFSKIAYLYGSYVSNVGLNDFKKSEEYCQNGLNSNPENNILLNNLAFSQASQNLTKEAESNLDKIDFNKIDDKELVFVTATKGLIEYRKGNYELGKELYLKSRNKAKLINNFETATRALLYLVKELFLSNDSEFEKYYSIAKEEVKEYSKMDKDLSIILKNIEKYYIDENKNFKGMH